MPHLFDPLGRCRECIRLTERIPGHRTGKGFHRIECFFDHLLLHRENPPVIDLLGKTGTTQIVQGDFGGDPTRHRQLEVSWQRFLSTSPAIRAMFYLAEIFRSTNPASRDRTTGKVASTISSTGQFGGVKRHGELLRPDRLAMPELLEELRTVRV